MKSTGKGNRPWNKPAPFVPTAFRPTVKCKKEGCRNWYKISPWKTGIDRDLCALHRNQVREQEAEEIIKKRNESSLTFQIDKMLENWENNLG